MIKDLKIISSEFIKELNCNASILKYKEKLRVIYFDDESEYFFSFCFKTLPEDETGEAHITEHSVLAGSKRYRTKDPFKELDNVSVATYLNAITTESVTLYPASSLIFSDFKQLFEVYSDAVFSPLLKRSTFKRERNIVKSEMSSLITSTDFIISKTMKETFFNNTPYMYEAGGMPSYIKELKYKKFLNFFKQNYNIHNCTLVLAGKKEVLDLLNIIGERYFD